MTPYEKSSAHNLCEEYKTYFINYKKYGDVVLEVETKLKDEPEIRAIFLKSETFTDYEKNIKDFWVKNFQIAISKCSDIERAYDNDMYDIEIPLVSSCSKSDLICYQAIVLEDFFNRLCSNCANETTFANVETDKFIYSLEVHKKEMSSFIKIYKKRIEKNSIIAD